MLVYLENKTNENADYSLEHIALSSLYSLGVSKLLTTTIMFLRTMTVDIDELIMLSFKFQRLMKINNRSVRINDDIGWIVNNI